MVTLEFGSPQFWSQLLQVITVDVLLAADNAVVVAVVVALACRNLPPHLRTRGILLGVAAAIALRVTLTLAAASVLALPGLKLVGAAVLLWIGVRLARPGPRGKAVVVAGGGRLGDAIRTVVLADAAMSVDNVLAVAAAARGEPALIVLALPVSIGLMVLASRVVLGLIQRAPLLVLLGGGLIGWIALAMAVADPVAAPWLQASVPALVQVAPALGAAFVIAAGALFARRGPPCAS